MPSQPSRTASSAPDWDQDLARLERLVGIDDGLFHLGVHALVEKWLLALHPELSNERQYSFGDKVDFHLGPAPTRPYHQALRNFIFSYPRTNHVRHSFAQLGPAEARSAAEALITLTRRAGLGTIAGTTALESHLASWPRYDPRRTESELAFLRTRLFEKERSEKSLQARVLALEAMEADRVRLETELTRRDLELKELEGLRERTDKDRSRIDTLRQESFRLKEELRSAGQALQDQAEALAYLDQLRTLHHASRTRTDYERTLMRLSEEQEGALKWFKPGANYLVRGGAGTGKTLVLMAAVRRIRADEAADLGLSAPRSIALLTYTRTLSTWSRQLLEFMVPDHGILDVGTVDRALNRLGTAILGPSTIEYQADRAFTALDPACSPEVWKELEDFVWARGLSREDYLDRRLPRTGMKRPLQLGQRQDVWNRGEALLGAMARTGTHSKHGHRVRLLRAIQEGAVVSPGHHWDVLAIDEVQDIPPVELAILRSMAGSLIMAGDPSQSLYQKGFSFKDAAIDINSRSRVLTANYRNTLPMARLAERFVANCPVKVEDATASTAHRDGLPPRLILTTDKSTDTLADSVLATIRYYTRTLGYQARSLAILAPENTYLDAIATSLDTAAIPQLRITRDSEDLHGPEGVRLSTIHSAKGLDFPVVIVVLPGLTGGRDLTDQARHQHQASLVYVAITRALENLTVILPATTDSTILKALADAFTEG